jgi:hypothetical protein
VRLGLRHVAGDDDKRFAQLDAEYQALVKGLNDAASARPFGDGPQIAAAARKLVAWADKLLPELQTKPYTRDEARRLLNLLSSPANARLPDYDTARQWAWAYQVIHSELVTKDANPKIAAVLGELDADLQLRLLPRQGEIASGKQYAQSLLRISAYDPQRFLARLQALSRLQAGN